MRIRFGVATAIAAISFASASALAPPAAAHVDPPTLTALHAFVGDPLWGLDTPQGTLVGVLPDAQTAQASTTKIMTLHLASIALSEGVVHLDDQVTIDALVASIGGSAMKDVNGVALEEGEVVSFGDLIRGMMYPSGNNAAWAIAEHVARAYFGGAAGVPEFVNLMNQHAADEGLVNTHFANPNGFDDPNHYTTARELAKLMNHAITDPFFQRVVGFVGTWNATTQAPGGGTKTYALSFPFFTPFPGYEGAKGGSTTNCNGANNGCMVMSGRRLGRRVVLGYMQGQPWSEETGLFNYAFATIFHPDPSGQSATLPAALAQDDLDCLSSSRAVSAVVEQGGPAKLVVWSTDVGGATITKLAEAVLPGSAKGNGAPKAVAVAHLPGGDVIMAYRKGAQVELSRWSLAANGTPTLLSSGIKAGPAAAMALQPVYGNMFLSVVANPDGDLVVKSWALQNGGPGLTSLGTYNDSSREYTDVAVAGPDHEDVYNGHRAVTAASDAAGSTVNQVWAVNSQTGEITPLGSWVEPGNHRSSLAPVAVESPAGELFPPVYYARGFSSGNFAYMRFLRIDSLGAPVDAGLAGSAVATQDVRVASLGTSGVMLAARSGTGDVRLEVWEARRKANNFIDDFKIVDHPAYVGASSLDLCRLPSTHAEGDYVTSSIATAGSQLNLRAFRSGDRP
jgi:D-alanyl-D-alanine carboxypeptidase